MRRQSEKDRELWTAYVEGRDAKPTSKYKSERCGKFASKHEAACAAKLVALERCGKISSLRFQVPIVLVPGKGKLRPVQYICDFTYLDTDGHTRWLDAKGFATPVYRLKKRLAALILGIYIEEL